MLVIFILVDGDLPKRTQPGLDGAWSYRVKLAGD